MKIARGRIGGTGPTMCRKTVITVCCCAVVGIYAAAEPLKQPPPSDTGRQVGQPAASVGIIEEDWLYQAGSRPTDALTSQEIAWTREMAERMARLPGTPDLSADLAELDRLAKPVAIPAAAQPPAMQPPVKLPDGLVGRWVHGDLGEGNYLNVGVKAAAIVAGNYALCAWIRTTSDEADVIGNGVTAGHFLLMTYKGVTRAHQWTAQGAAVLDGKTRVADGRWHHVSQVVDGDTLSLVVDGRIDGSMKIPGAKTAKDSPDAVQAVDDDAPLPAMDGKAAGATKVPSARTAASSAVTIGSRGGATSHFEGTIDDVCVFDRALSVGQIAVAFPAERAPKIEVSPNMERYLAVRRIKRRIMFKDPAIDFTKVLFVDQPFPAGGEWDHEAKHRLGRMATSGGELVVLDGLNADGKVRKLAPQTGAAAFWRPDISFDVRKVLFCMKANGERSFHLYETNLDSSGAGDSDLRQLTDSLYDDLDPIYLPGGKIVFSTTRGNTYIRCMPETHAYVLARCDADGRNIYIISRNNECDWLPSLLDDGRICYSRWEYSDKPLWRLQKLWTMNQDGTSEAMFWGNQSAWPDHVAMPRAIPNSRRVMFVGVGHHTWFSGSVGILDTDRGLNYPHGVTRVTWDVPWAEVNAGPADKPESSTYHASGRFRAYHSPYPLSEELFLVSAAKKSNFDSLYLMDVRGNRELIWRGQHNVLHAIPVRPRTPPPSRSDAVVWPGVGISHKPTRPGVLFSPDVYQGVPDLPRGIVKSLRVVQQDFKTYSTWRPREGGSQGPGVSGVQVDAVKRILGTVPVAEDGSFSVEVPAGVALFCQLLDDKGRAVHTMRSFTGVMPGESRGCLGCHELHSSAPPGGLRQTAVARSVLKPPSWGTNETIGYERFVQSTLDKRCGRCHQGDGRGRGKLDLTLRPGQGPYKEPYLTLVGPLRAGVAATCGGLDLAAAMKPELTLDYGTIRPLTHLSVRSRLIDIASSGKHNDVRIGGEELERLIAWVDMNAPYRGEEEIRAIPDVPASVYRNDGVEPPILPKTRTAPVIDRLNIPQDYIPQRDAPVK